MTNYAATPRSDDAVLIQYRYSTIVLDSPRRELARRLWQTIERTSDTLREVLEIRIQTSGGSALRRAYCEPLQQRRELQEEGEGDRQEQRHTRSDLHNLLQS